MKTEHVERGNCDPVCDTASCMFCDGGLFACTVCGAFEGATPDDCPGRQMTEEESNKVYAGELNYRDGQWRDECCQVMRPRYDTVAYMAEAGYVPDGVNAFGNTIWKKVKA